MNTQYVVIVAGGSGSRMKSSLAKQFIELAGKPILMRTIEVFYRFNPAIKIAVVLPRDQISFWKELCQKHGFLIDHEIIEGGETRFHSVKNGLSAVSEDGLVAIHDGVRPLVSLETINRCFEKASGLGNAVPCIPVYESVRSVHGETSSIIDRKNLRLIQTPQIFSNSLIKEAYKQAADADFTDDASVLERMGYVVHLVEGNRENIKITDPLDLAFAEHFLTLQ
jgi:2-C-methyl-D-erythritol 4-phosphate cytidylyltransferase